jgi:hypothetical protein
MRKLKITKVNILLFIVVILLTVVPQLIEAILGKYWDISILDLIENNETAKVVALLMNQYLLVLLPVIVFAIFYKVEVKRTFRLNSVGIPVIALTIIMAASVWVVSQFATIVLYHIYSSLFGRPSNDIAQLIPHIEVWGFLLIVLTPAICEEALFRGLVLRAYENLGTYRAIFISALLFSAIHLSVLRFIGPLFIGILSGYLVVKSNSIIPGILTHFTFNGISISLFYFTKTLPEQTERFPNITEYLVLLIIVIFNLSVLAACFMAFNYFTRPRTRGNSASKMLRMADLLLFNGNTAEQVEFKKPLNSKLQDFTAVITHWPIVLIIIIIGVINITELLSAIL